MNIVFFTGAGGTGKTSVLNELGKHLADEGIKFETFLSVSRDFFKAEGITTEQAGLERPEADRLVFQARLFEFYCLRLEEELYKARNADVEVFVADRSPFDHLAYLVYNSPNLMTLERLVPLLERARNIVRQAKDLDTTVRVWLFPCTAKWMTAKVVNDGMRHAPFGKNFMIHSLIEGAMAEVGVLDYLNIDDHGNGSIESRVDYVIDITLNDL